MESFRDPFHFQSKKCAPLCLETNVMTCILSLFKRLLLLHIFIRRKTKWHQNILENLIHLILYFCRNFSYPLLKYIPGRYAQGRNMRGAGWQFPKDPRPSAILRGPTIWKKRFCIIVHFYRGTWACADHPRTHTDIHPEKNSEILTFWHSNFEYSKDFQSWK